MTSTWYNTNREWENYIQEIRVDRGMTVQMLADDSDIYTSQVNQLMNGMTSPIYQVNAKRGNKGEIKPWVEKICMILKVKPENMFPREVCPLEDPSTKGLHISQLNAICLSDYCQHNTYESAKLNSLKKFIWRFIVKKFWFRKNEKSFCHPKKYKRIVKVLQWRFLLGLTFDEIGSRLNVGKQRVRQIECEGLRRMRHPSFATHLQEYIEALDDC